MDLLPTPPSDPTETARVEAIARHFAAIMRLLDFDLADPQLRDTPHRVGRLYLDILRRPPDQREPSITCLPNAENYRNIMLVRDIDFFSICAHHLMPFFGKVHIAYIPHKVIVELGTVTPMVDFFARRPQLQEQFTERIADFLQDKLAPRGLICLVEARHLCLEICGAVKSATPIATSAIRGCYQDQSARAEVLKLLS